MALTDKFDSLGATKRVGSLLDEFKAFAFKGNVVDLAIGIIIGAAFTAIVQSFVKDILTPLIGVLGKANFENMFLILKSPSPDKPQGPFITFEEAEKAGAVTLHYGVFLNAVINFLLVALVLFFVVKTINKFRKKEEAAPAPIPDPTKEELLLTEIRDLLAAKQK